MASFSSASPINTKKRKYDVFLSFRGEDTRQNITSHLNSALRRKSVETFIDDELERGEEITPGLEKVIEGCTIAVIIFSKDYASSAFCLDEVAKIIQCHETHGQIVLPIFYYIVPSDVENQTGSFAIAFSEHYEIYNSDRVRNWKSALSIAANMAGWDSQITRPESKLVDSIVEDILEKLKHAFSCDILEGFVGLNSRIDEIIGLLSNESSGVCILGIWGQGGIGKTTLAEAVFNRIGAQYDGCCFLPNVRERSEKHDGLTSLGKKRLSELLGVRKLKISTPRIGYSFYVRMLSRKSVLVVLDDVNNSNQLDSLVGSRNWFGAGSRIIVTSRDRQVLNTIVDYVYEVEKLKDCQALQLFNLNAFKKTSPTQSYRFLSQSVIKYADGIPLALKVLGSMLCDKNEREWESALDRLKNTPHKDIQRVLRLSYDSLDEDVKKIFLHLACFFNGSWISEVKAILEDCCGFSFDFGLGVLRDKCLISDANFNDFIDMHDLIEEMGKEIVREECRDQPGKRSRLWDPKDIIVVLRKNVGTEAIEAIFFDMSESTPIDDAIEIDLNPNVFARMSNLKLLKLHRFGPKSKVSLSQGLEYLSNELRYFEWIDYPAKTLPANFLPVDLVELHLRYSKLERLPSQFFKDLHKLKAIDLCHSSCLVEFPELTGALSLTTIDLHGCKSLSSFPSCIHLKSLESLNLYNCHKLNRFPEVSRNIISLELSGTGIEEVPSSVKVPCQIAAFPDGILKASFLDLSDCPKLEKLPEKLKVSWSFKPRGCHLSKLLSDLSGLSLIKELDLSYNRFETLPESIKQLSLLRTLDISFCNRLQALPDLPLSLKCLYAHDCTSLAIVSNLKQVFELECEDSSNTKNFMFTNCFKLDPKARSEFLNDAQLAIQRSASNWSRAKLLNRIPNPAKQSFKRQYTSMRYPGSEMPEWLTYTSAGSSIKIPCI